ncbi:MAG TPA: ornithine acetyltransferase [Verrucomicrobia bacterium]|nr:ornithine acetyltransferase [Verrucomicrobiota bacterium]
MGKAITEIEGGVTAAMGFRASGICAGIKANAPDLALLVSDVPASAAGVFTKNAMQAAPVKLCRSVISGGLAQAVVVNSGCANACTGADGMVRAQAVAAATATALGVAAGHVLVCSTGTIGKKLPVEKIENGMKTAVEALCATGGNAAARAIMTTDTVDKQYAVKIQVGGVDVHIGGMAKGAGMIAPNMATMLAFITTDAAVVPAALQRCVSGAVQTTFNRITIDGDQSTNDTLLVMANGLAMKGRTPLDENHPDWSVFVEALESVARELALKIVRDGEGATCFVTVTVNGAATHADATLAAKAIANSLLCKTSWFGGDPNWGRVICAIGYSGATVDPDRVDIAFDELMVVRNGLMAPDVAFSDLEAVFARKVFAITANLNLGDGTETMYTCDCSYEYVRINAEYMT